MALLNLLDIIRPRSLLYYIPFVVMAGLIMARKASNYLLMVISAYGAVISPVVYAVYLYLRFKPFVADMSFITGYVYLYLSTVFFAAILLFAIGTIREIANPNKKKKEDLFRLSFSIVLVLYCLSPFYLHRVERASFNFYPILAMILSLLTLRLKHYLPQFRWHMIVGIIAVGTSIHLMIGLLQIEVIKLASAYGIISPQAVTLQQINKGLLTGAPPGPWNREVSDMVRYVQHNIPANDSLIAFPGDDPIHYLTGRKPVLPFFQFNPETLAHTTREYCGQIDREQVKWIVVRTHPQCYIDCAWPGEEEVKSYIITHYRLDKRINGYDIFRRL